MGLVDECNILTDEEASTEKEDEQYRTGTDRKAALILARVLELSEQVELERLLSVVFPSLLDTGQVVEGQAFGIQVISFLLGSPGKHRIDD
jgi:hypothetical protein